jgi:hypothetical protein
MREQWIVSDPNVMMGKPVVHAVRSIAEREPGISDIVWQSRRHPQ